MPNKPSKPELTVSASARMTAMVFRSRRRIATVLAIMLAVSLGYHVVVGHNGITAYQQKRSEDKLLKVEIDALREENARLKGHVDRLQADPDAIEHEARERLHYTRPGEVIYTLNEKPAETAPAPQQKFAK